jgi:hypothetical protein
MHNIHTIDLEHLPNDPPLDETDVNLRGYLASLSDDHLRQYHPAWSDEQLMTWDGNFRSDGALMLICCERDVDAVTFRQALEQHLLYRFAKNPEGRSSC